MEDVLFSLVGEERHSWNVRTVAGKSCVSITFARLGKLERSLETGSRLRLYVLIAFLGFPNFHLRLYKSIEIQKVCCTYTDICVTKNNMMLTSRFCEIRHEVTPGNKNAHSKQKEENYEHTEKNKVLTRELIAAGNEGGCHK